MIGGLILAVYVGPGADPRGEGRRGGGAEQRHLWLPFRNRLRHHDDRQLAVCQQECAHQLPAEIRSVPFYDLQELWRLHKHKRKCANGEKPICCL